MSNTITVYGDTGNVTPTYFRTTQPSGGIIYPPGVTPGPPCTIGCGDGGFDTPSDYTINQPVITFPNALDNTEINDTDTATSSAFVATGGRAHIASRWMIYYVGPAGDVDADSPEPTILYDSQATAVNLTSLPFTSMLFEHESEYKILVRYKAGTTNTWSPWSEYQNFFTDDCIPDAYVRWDFSDAASLGIVAGRIATVTDLGTAGINLTADNTGTVFDPLYSTAQFADGAVLIGGKEGFLLSGPLQDVAGKLTLIFVAYWVNNPGFDGALMLTQNTNTLVVGGYQAGFQQLIAIPGLGYGYCASVPVPPSILTPQTLTTGKHILIISIDSAATSRIYLDGVEAATSTNNFSTLVLNHLCAQAGTMIARNYHLAEFIAYDVALTPGQVEFEYARLVDKWGI